MDNIDFLPDLVNGAPFYLNAFGVAIVVYVLVWIIKRLFFKEEQKAEYWYDGAIVLIGSVLGIIISVGALFGNNVPLSWPLIVTTVFTGILYGALASGGYQLFKGGREFIAGWMDARKVLKIVGGDNIEIGSMEHVVGSSVGEDSGASVHGVE